MSRRHARSLTSRLVVLVLHLLKWQYQSQQRSSSWRHTIIEQRQQILVLLQDSPSFRTQVPGILQERYPVARARTLAETGLSESILRRTCPWTVDAVCDTAFWPEG